ncbi:MAG: bacillithiol biosynthesis deacetylase BshB1 [Crocinitomicaceae bacterium]|nr:bacillithiol biosynthesis deacetylase BshB1 [Crocinitomicaceae bacterium]
MKVDILCIGAHPDDVELSCSGTVLKSIAQGKKVALIDLTEGELGSNGTIETRYAEAAEASKILGISDRVNLKMQDGFFEITEENLRKLIVQIRRFRPDIVLCNAVSDRHPDHGRGGDLASRACFLSGLVKIKTELEGKTQERWRPKAVYRYIQDRYLKPDFVVDITDFVDQKMASIKAYKTQFYDPKHTGINTPISGENFLTALKGKWADYGRSIGVDYAEGFNVERPMGVEDLSDIL